MCIPRFLLAFVRIYLVDNSRSRRDHRWHAHVGLSPGRVVRKKRNNEAACEAGILKVENPTLVFYKNISRTSAVSSTYFYVVGVRD